MVKVDDVDDFKTFGHSKPQKEEPFLKAVTDLAKSQDFYGKQKSSVSWHPKAKFSDEDVIQIDELNQRVTHMVNKHHPHQGVTKRPKTSKK